MIRSAGYSLTLGGGCSASCGIDPKIQKTFSDQLKRILRWLKISPELLGSIQQNFNCAKLLCFLVVFLNTFRPTIVHRFLIKATIEERMQMMLKTVERRYVSQLGEFKNII